MLRRKRIALAATASSLLVAGALAALALTVTSGSARADTANSCNGIGSPVACGWTSSDPVVIAYPTAIGLWASATPSTLSVTLSYDVTCYSSSGSATTGTHTVTQPNGGAPYNITLPDTSPNECSVVASATLPGTYLSGSAPTPTATSTATAAPTSTLEGATLNFQVTDTTSASASPTATTSSAGSTTLSNLVSGYGDMCMDDSGHSSAERTPVSVWRCNDTDTAQNFTYWGSELRTNGLCVNAKGNGKSGSKLILWKCTGSANEIFIRKGSEWVEKANSYKLCIDDPAYSTRGGTQLIVYTCHNQSNQHWTKP
jgi:ricin-type beta-trefoil lectin protein